MNTKLKYLIFTLFIPFIALSQNEDRLIVDKGIYIYNNSKDTLKLSIKDCELLTFGVTLNIEVFKKITIGNSNEKGVVFFSSNCVKFKELHGGTFDISEIEEFTKYEIWNLKTKELLFESINSYNINFNRELMGGGIKEKGIYLYQYDFIIDENGRIIIRNLKSEEKYEKMRIVNYNLFKPDNEEGIYELVDGKYIKTE